MLRSVFFFLFGLALLALVTWLGFTSVNNTAYVLWFGLASAILAPIGLGSIGLAFKRNKQDVIDKIEKIPAIERLIEEAETQEEKIELLKKERAQVIETVKFEARRGALLNRRELLEADAARIVGEMKVVNEELVKLDKSLENSPVTEEVKQLEELIRAKERGDLVIRAGDKYYFVNPELFNVFFPFGGGWLSRIVFTFFVRIYEFVRVSKVGE